MSVFWIEIEADLGSTLLDCATDAIAIANRLQINVRYKFNDMRCICSPGDDPTTFALECERVLNEKRNHRIAVGKPKP